MRAAAHPTHAVGGVGGGVGERKKAMVVQRIALVKIQEIEAVLNHLNIQLRKIRRKHFQKYLEAYARALTSRDAEKYVDGEDEVIDFETIINEVAYLRNRYLGIMKAMESKNFMLGHVVRLRAAGMEDIQL